MVKSPDESKTSMEKYLRTLLQNINKEIESAERDINRFETKIEASEISDNNNEDSLSITKDNINDLENAIERYKKIRSYIETCILAENSLQDINNNYMNCPPEDINNEELLLEKMEQIESQIQMAIERDTLDEFNMYSETYANFSTRISKIQIRS